MLYKVYPLPFWISHTESDALLMLKAFENTYDLEVYNLMISIDDMVVSRIDGSFYFFVNLEGLEAVYIDDLTVVYSNLDIRASLKNGCWIHYPIRREESQ